MTLLLLVNRAHCRSKIFLVQFSIDPTVRESPILHLIHTNKSSLSHHLASNIASNKAYVLFVPSFEGLVVSHFPFFVNYP